MKLFGRGESKSVRRERLRQRLSLYLPLVMLAWLPPLSHWIADRYQITLADLVLPLILATISTSILALIFWRSFQRERLSAYLGAFFSTILLTDRYSDRFSTFWPLLKVVDPLPRLGGVENLFFSLVFDALAILAGWTIALYLSRLIKRYNWPVKEVTGGILVALSVAFILQAFSVGRSIIIEWPQFFYRPPQVALAGKVSPTTPRPDIYYLVLDRYTSQNVLQTQFNYDNSAFLDYLKSNQFSVDPNAHSNYPYTAMSISSTLQANYHTDQVEKFSGASQQTVEPYQDTIRYSPVISQLKSSGYAYYELGTWYETTNKAPLADFYYQPDGQLSLFNHRFTLNTFSKNDLVASLYYPIASEGARIGGWPLLNYSSQSEVDATISKISRLKQLAAAPSGGRFIFAHLLIPHDPYYFNADGSLSTTTGNNNDGEPIKQKYLGQVEYINGQVKQIVASILQHSQGQAIIIIQSDEGPYPMVLNDQDFDSLSVGDELSDQSMLKWSINDLKMKFGILAAYHIPQATSQDLARGGDSVNIFRVIFNRYFNGSLAYLPRCYYAYPNGREEEFVYQNINLQLTGQSSSLCPANSDFGPASLK